MSRPSRHKLRDTLIGALAVAFVVSPNFLRNYGYGLDYTNHPWFIWNQGLAIANTGHPTMWLHASGGLGIFQPLYGFYGGSLYAIVGGFSALIGQRPDMAYVLSIVLFVTMAYRGVWSLGEQAGIGRGWAHLPAFIFITSAYFITDIYGRGAWTEFAAVSALIFSIAYASLLAREPWTAKRVAAFGFGVILATGSHNITLLWGGLLTLIIGGGALYAAKSSRVPAGRVARVVGLAVLATLVNAWFLLFDIVHSRDVYISIYQFDWPSTKMFDTPGAILNPFRVTPVGSTTASLVITAPIFALILAVVIRVRARNVDREATALTRRLWTAAAAGVVLVLVLMMMPGGLWNAMPRELSFIQFPYRLASWLSFLTAVVLMLSLRFVPLLGAPAKSVIGMSVAALVALTVLQAGSQLFPRHADDYTKRDRSMAFANGAKTPPQSFYDPGSYRDGTLPVVAVDDTRIVTLPTPEAGATSLSANVTLPAGDGPILTNLDLGPWNARVEGTGFKVVGRAPDGRIVIARTPGGPDQVRMTVTADGGATQTVGGALSIVALLGLLGLVGTLAVRERRERRGGPAAPVAPGDDAVAADPVDSTPHLDKV